MALKTLTGLWPSKNGNLSVKTNEELVIPRGVRLMILQNKNRQKETHPTHNLVIADDGDDQKVDRPAQPAPAAEYDGF